MQRLISDSLLLTRRSLIEAIRQPANDITNVFFPLFFLVVTVGAVGNVAAEAFGVDDYKGFQLPVAVLQGAAAVAGGGGLATTVDIQSGYFEKMLLTSTPRFAIPLGRMLADGVKAMLLAVVIIVFALAIGSGFETGLPGMVVLVLGTGVFAVVYSALGMAIGLKTGSPQAATAAFILFFPLVFLAPTLAPTEVFQSWLEAVARVNPVTYILEGMRSLVVGGWDLTDLLQAAAAIAGMGVFTMSLTVLAMRSRAG